MAENIINRNYREIQIQCPDCSSIFIFKDGECFCKKCDRAFSESEVRERCGL